MARLIRPPGMCSFSQITGRAPRMAKILAASSPAGPAPIIRIRLFSSPSSYVGWRDASLPVNGFCTQKMAFLVMDLRQPWLQPRHRQMGSLAVILLTKSGSASIPRPTAVKSAVPSLRSSSASSGELIRPTAMTGIRTARLTHAISPRLKASGTSIGAEIYCSESGIPMETWMASAPAASRRGAIFTVSSMPRPCPPGIRSLELMRQITGNSLPQACFMDETISR